jgi:hypothetical protein
MPTPPRSSSKVHSAAGRRATSSGVNIGAIAHLDAAGLTAFQFVLRPGLISRRRRRNANRFASCFAY